VRHKISKRALAVLLLLLSAASLSWLADSAFAAGAGLVPVVPNEQSYAQSSKDLQSIGMEEAWGLTTGSPNVQIACVDSGVAPNNDFAGRLQTGSNVVDGSTNTTDIFGHGTEVCSVAAAQGNNGYGVAGVCWQCKIYPVKDTYSDTTGYAHDSDIASGLLKACQAGSRVVILSQEGPDDPGNVPAAATACRNMNDVVVMAAGNYHSNQASADRLAAESADAITVAECDSPSQLNAASDYGPLAKICAPSGAQVLQPDGSYVYRQGTSIAAPYVGGVIALMLSGNPNLTYDQIVQVLQRTCTPEPNLDVQWHCYLNAPAALRDPLVGFKDPPDADLKVVRKGSGTVVDTQGSIDCGSICSESFPSTSPATLRAKPAAGWKFSHWTGACSGTNPLCNLTVQASPTTTVVGAIFVPTKLKIKVTTGGKGHGTVKVSGCGVGKNRAISVVNAGCLKMTFVAKPDKKSRFAGWTGACHGQKAVCVLRHIMKPQTTKALFSPKK
jgi:hypothetical protein